MEKLKKINLEKMTIFTGSALIIQNNQPNKNDKLIANFQNAYDLLIKKK